ncbi:TetR/AcrR family transcriptional regulator [Paenibacillus radicis (ex Gao et al. 2016)]|uniref:TetR family transcriptional regulator n=1 Tax=Paenibacillus radicis (ex Gao et al. 2016) TaxID=1737354 RepID=A0A917GR45_9BACL|nr:TetR/AcrR family transcriptional regulator [Paenibacillus radicis (ex Gao et al. 2016)]GGG54379.1 TetR family transcriptional regulator [Paenibacillus radicis (ex Gao et al. 2016)]
MSKRDDIMNTTLDLIDEEGLQSVTFAKIMKRANVGSGTIFNYFGGKEELVNEVYRKARIHMGACMLEGYDPETELYERFKGIQLNRLRFAIDFPKEYRFIDSYSYSPYISPDIRNMEDDSREAMESIITDGQKQGIIREMNVMLCHQIIHGIITAVVRGYQINKYPLNELQVHQSLEACWKAIKV